MGKLYRVWRKCKVGSGILGKGGVYKVREEFVGRERLFRVEECIWTGIVVRMVVYWVRKKYG